LKLQAGMQWQLQQRFTMMHLKPAAVEPSPPSGNASSAAVLPELLHWLLDFKMETILLKQLLALKPRIWERACCGVFAGKPLWGLAIASWEARIPLRGSEHRGDKSAPPIAKHQADTLPACPSCLPPCKQACPPRQAIDAELACRQSCD
jgi:hypothetical protein